MLALSAPGALALQPGDLIAVRQGGPVWRVDPATGAFEVLYQGDFMPRAGVAVDRQGALLVTAASNAPPLPSLAVIRIQPETGEASVVSSGGLLGPAAYDLAVSPAGEIYVAAGSEGLVRIDASTGIQQLIAAPPAIFPPFGIAFDEGGGLWIASFAGTPQISRVDPVTGQVLTLHTVDSCAAPRNARLLVATTDAIFLNCSQMSTTPPGTEASAILRVDPTSGAAVVVSSAGLMEDPYGLALEPSGDLILADSGRVIRIDPLTGEQTLVAETGNTGIAVFRAACDDGLDNDGDGSTDFPVDPQCTMPADLSERDHPCGDGLDNDGDGAIDYPEDAGCRHSRWTSEDPSCDDGLDNDGDGAADLADLECEHSWMRLERPIGSGDLFVVDESAALVRIDPVTGAQESLGERGYLETPTGVAVGPDRSLLIADPGAGIVRIDSTGEPELLAAGDSLVTPQDVAVEAYGSILVADPGAGSLLRIDPVTGDEQVVTSFVTPPGAVAVEATGYVLVAEPATSSISRVDPISGGQQVLSQGAPLTHPAAIAVAENGEILIPDAGSAALLRVDAATGTASVVSQGGLLVDPRGVDVQPGGDAFVTDVASATVVRIELASGAQSVLSSGALLSSPRGVVVVKAACRDRLDNDADGLVDFLDDPGCDAAADDSERSPLLPCDDGLDQDGDTFVDFPQDPGCDSPTDPSERSSLLICDDGLDDDGDGLIDFPSDPGCSGPEDLLETDPELLCDDGLDNDGDGWIDFPGDQGCGDPRWPREDPACQDAEDNDEDGATDYPDDPGCDDPSDLSETSAALICDDGSDNDADGLLDVSGDPGCDDAFDISEQSPTLVCDDGVDNDGDGQIDYPADPGCDFPTDPSENAEDLICDDGIDNDGDGLADYPSDPGCEDPEDGFETAGELPCDDGIDNDGDGWVDFPEDPGCGAPGWPVEHPACDDGVDNDADGASDHPADPDCLAPSDTSEATLLSRCADGLDNDSDGFTDHPDDPGCAGPDDGSERSALLVCDDGIDQDSDGAVDFPGDAGCESPLDSSEGSSELVCDNGIDDDGDGLADYPADPGCSETADVSEAATDLPCDDGLDNDSDGAIDFPADSGCYALDAPTESPAPDDRAPSITNVEIALGETTARVSWRTDEPASSRVDFGLSNSYGQLMVNPGFVQEHALILEGLDCGTVYHYVVTSLDPAGNTGTGGSRTFDTLSCGAGSAPWAHWRLDEGAGTAAADDGAGGYTGALVGPQWVEDTADASPAALGFDGIDDVVDLGDLQIDGSEITIALWFKATDFGVDFQDGRLVSKATGVMESDHQWALSTRAVDGAVRLRSRLRTEGSTKTLVASSGDLVPGVWVHAAAVYDGETMRIYKDGVAVGNATKEGPLESLQGVPAAIGNQPSGAGEKPFHGIIDDVRIYDRALEPVEIQGLYGNLPAFASQSEIRTGRTWASISWRTDQPSATQIDYGLTAAYEIGVVTHSELSNEHAVELTGLSPGRIYHYRLTTRTETGVLFQSADAMFRTSSSSGGACGMLGGEVLPVMLASFLARRRRRAR